MLDRPPGPMHEVIRRAQDELRVHSNSYGTIDLISAALQQSKAPDDGSAPRVALNRTQRFHLMLLRADAYSATRQHEFALEDAHAALRLSSGQSAEALFTIGRELLRLHHPDEAVAAFDRGEAQLSSGTATDIAAVSAAATTDADFWAQRGLGTDEVGRQRLSRREEELLEQQEHCGAEEPPATSKEPWTWRRLAREARALLNMRTLHFVPLCFLPSAIALLEHCMNTRTGLILCVENTTCWPFRLRYATSPSGTYHAGMRFPDTIAPGNCGLALVVTARWGGFSGSVCYDVGEKGVFCVLCYESPFLGSVRCGVRFVSEQHGAAEADAVRELRFSKTNLWIPTHTASLPSGRRLKVCSSVRGASGSGGGRAVVFSVAEVLSVRLRSIELLRALEFAGPVVLKKMSTVNRRYRELVNNLPPHMFFAAGRRSYPDYCLIGDRMSSPWIVRDKEPVTWLLIFDSRSGNRENYIVVDSSDQQNVILLFSAESTGALEALVYYGDRRSLIAQIKSSWVPFKSTLYISSASGRTFASCAVKQQSHLEFSWEGWDSKSKLNDVEFIMQPGEVTGYGLERSPKTFLVSTLAGSVSHSPETRNTASSYAFDEGMALHKGTRSTAPQGKPPLIDSFSVWRSMRSRRAAATQSASSQSNGGIELVAEMVLNVSGVSSLTKGTTICKMKICPGTDALLLSLFVYCRSQWGR